MDNISAFSDRVLQQRIGNNLKNARLKQNITQQSLAENADISMQKNGISLRATEEMDMD